MKRAALQPLPGRAGSTGRFRGQRDAAVRVGPWALALLFATLSGCDPEVTRIPGAQCQIDLRLFTPPLQDAFAGVSSLRFGLSYPDGRTFELELDQSAKDFVLGAPPAEGVALRIEGLDIDGLLVSSGQSVAFDLDADQVTVVDVLFARVGEFARLVSKLNTPRFGHTASLTADGLVLIFGGAGAGDLDAPGWLAPPELYDPRSQTNCGPGAFDCPSATGVDLRLGHTATSTFAGNVFVFGGLDEAGQLVDAVLIFEAQSRTFRQLASYDPARVRSRAWHSSVALKIEEGGDPNREALLIAGGERDEGGIPIVDSTGLLFDTRLETFYRTDLAMVRARKYHSATVLDPDQRGVLLAGGRDSSGLVGPVELFDGQAFQAVSPAGAGADDELARPRVQHAALQTPDGVMIVGGQDGLVSLDAPELFAFNSSLGTGMFALRVDAAHADHRARSGALVAGLSSGEVLVAGGEFSDGFERRLLGTAERLVPEPAAGRASFEAAAPLNRALGFATLTHLPGGGLLYTGGLVDGPDGPVPTDEVWYFNPR